MNAVQPNSGRSPRTSDIAGVIRRGTRPAAIVSVGAAIVVLITLSPLALGLIATRRHVDWTRLGNVGQAYGAISAVLSALALIAIAASLGLQARESLANRRQVHRNIHMKLTEMAMSDPLYMSCWGPNAQTMHHDDSRLTQFLNLTVSFWYMQWELRDLTDQRLMSLAANGLFQTSAGRKFWIANREQWTADSVGSRLTRFRDVLDRALSAVLATEPESVDDPPEQDRTAKRADRNLIRMASATSVAIAAWLIVRDVRRNRPAR